jgi:hypothetical protein
LFSGKVLWGSAINAGNPRLVVRPLKHGPSASLVLLSPVPVVLRRDRSQRCWCR